MILYRPTGELMEADDWTNPGIRTLAVALDGRQIVDEDGATSPDRLLLCINGFWEPIEFALPSSSKWRTVISTADGPECEVSATGSVMAPPRSLTLLQTR